MLKAIVYFIAAGRIKDIWRLAGPVVLDARSNSPGQRRLTLFEAGIFAIARPWRRLQAIGISAGLSCGRFLPLACVLRQRAGRRNRKNASSHKN